MEKVKLKPILFNTEMVRAILGNGKTVTRRVLKTEKYIPDDAEFGYTAFTPKGCISYRGTFVDENGNKRCGESFIKIPYQVGDILYVRETHALYDCKKDCPALKHKDFPKCNGENTEFYIYATDGCVQSPCGVWEMPYKWTPSIHMPKEAARIFLRVTDVRVERLQDIDGYGVLAEGVDNGSSNPTMGKRWENMQRMAYSKLWNSTVKKSDLDKYGWDANPWVTVNVFERISREETQQ